MNRQDFQVLVIRYLAGELSAAEKKLVQEEAEADLEKRKFFEDYRKVWEHTKPSSDFPELPDIDKKWEAFAEVAFKESKLVSLRERVRPYLQIAAVILFLITGILAWSTLNRSTPRESEYLVEQSHGSLKQIDLPDGSLVFLDKGSEIRFEKSFAFRDLHLKGKALFEVKHLEDDAPFVVWTAGTKTTVLGTIFMVDALGEEGEVKVYVKEGRVAFQEEAQPTTEEILEAGDQGVFQVESRQLTKTEKVNEGNQLSWKTGAFRFEDATLGEILPLLEHYYNVAFKVENAKLLKCTYRTDFSDISLEDIIEELTFGLGVEISEIAPSNFVITGSTCR